MIETPNEGTSFCPQCERYAKRIEKLQGVVKAAERLIYPPRVDYAPGSKKAALREALLELSRPEEANND